MEIQVYRQRNTIPATTGGVPISPEKVAEPYLAEAQQGAAISKIGFEAADLNQRFQAAEQRAERVVQAQRLESSLKDAFLNAHTKIDTNGDYEQYETSADTSIAKIKAQHIDSINDPIVKRAAESVFMTQSGDLKRYAKVQKIKKLVEKSDNLYLADYENAVIAYSNEVDETKRAVIKDTLRIKGLELENANIRQLGSTKKAMLDFDQKAEAIYAGQLINKNAEVAYSYLNERNEDGVYKNLPNLKPENRIGLINNAETGMRIQRTENERQWRKQQEDATSDLLNKLDNPKYSRQKLMAEISILENTKDVKTGERIISPVTAHSLRRTIISDIKSEAGEGSSTEFIRMGDRILSGSIKSSEDIINNPNLKNGEKKQLANMYWGEQRRDDKAETAEAKAEQKLIKEKREFIRKSADKTIDALIPNKGKTKELNASLKGQFYTIAPRYQTLEDLDQYQAHIEKTIDYATKQASSWRAGHNRDTAKMIIDAATNPIETINKAQPAQANSPTTGVKSEADARKELTALKITGTEQDKWIKTYREKGKVK